MNKTDHQTIQEVLDGSISPHDFVGFQQRIRAEPEFSKLYSEYALLHHSLCEEFGSRPVSDKPVPRSQRAFPAGLAWLSAVAVLTIAVAIFYQYKSPSGPPPVMATVKFSADAVGKTEVGLQRGEGSVKVSEGWTRQLLQGQAAISPNPGATVISQTLNGLVRWKSSRGFR